MKIYFQRLVIILIALFFWGCKKDSDNKPLTLEEQGRLIYMSRCLACHNSDPSLPGSLGPEISGATVELLSLKILKGQYPDGYAAKRATKMMPPMPELEDKITALHSYLNAEPKK